MASFILKIDSEYAPQNKFKPKLAEVWEGEIFRLPSKKVPSYPVIGDILFIWTHETRGGEGLKAKCVVSKVLDDSKKNCSVRVENVVLYDKLINNKSLKKLKDSSSVASSIVSFSHTQLLYLDDQEVLEFEAVVSRIIINRDTKFPETMARINNNSLEKAIKNTGDMDRLFREQRFEARPKQSAFRNALIEHYKGCCCITGYDAVEGLEAAHIVPFANRQSDRDKPENGLLLRADIHKLFDRLLITINPENSTVWLSEKLCGSAYEDYEGKIIQHSASTHCLGVHFDQAMKQMV